jgi:hypothetical protein
MESMNLRMGRKFFGRGWPSSLLVLAAACATGRGTARADQLTKDISAQVPKTWKLAAEPNRGGMRERIYALPNGCAVRTLYTECPPTGSCDYEVYNAEGLEGQAVEVGGACCGSDTCMPTPVKGHGYVCDMDDDASPPGTARLGWAVQHRRDRSWIFDTAVIQFFFATKQPKVGELAAVLQCPAAAYRAEKPEFDAFVKTIKHSRDVGPPK